jgi:hypothetical protein
MAQTLSVGLGVTDIESVQAAITALNSLQTNYAIVEELRKAKSRDEINERSIPEMVEWLERIGYKVRRSNFDRSSF